ncbi:MULTISPECIES: sialate O-acetylesterase [Emticicia]|uniref:T9SS type A sorting domain-containing protein n=1 Tax=Emticicia TaxID=312278 RepID=UPI0007D8BC44|nr:MULTISPECIES: sialate O-acetylesterase [Emticicia]
MNYLKIGLVMLMNLILLDSFSQIQITFPVTRIVFQRNNQNQASINIAGSYFQQLDKIEVRAVPVTSGQGTETSWNVAQNFNNNGIFNTTITLSGGWYNIEARGILNGNIVASTKLEKVGIGEVFIVAGQSNAQGDPAYSGAQIGAADDRVSTINYYDPILNEDNLPFQFSQLGNNTKMAPYNYVPWFWARLGDKLVQKLNVPVLFYGAALGGLSCEVWRRSAEGEDLRNELPLFVKVAGMPYRGLKAALQQYVTRTGVRGVLWQQGESDDKSNAEYYYNNLKTIIEKSRSDARKNDLAWVVARSSRNPFVWPAVIEGQNLTIQRISNVFTGPSTDEIVGTNFRADGIHFFNDGLAVAADYWNSFLDRNFFANSQPLMARSLPVVNIACNSDATINKFTISTGGYPFYKWSNGITTNVISATSGTYSFKAIDDAGNTVFSQPFTLSPNNDVTQPSITANGNTTFCDGQGVVLTSNLATGNVWSNGERGQSIIARKAENYTVVNYSLNGCKSKVSNSISISTIPSPINVINTTKSIPICPDETLELYTNNNDGVSYLWNTNETSKRITVSKEGTYNLKIKGQNGCESQSFIDVVYRPRPTTNILADGETSFCLGKSVNIFSENTFATYLWNTGATTKSINVRTDGVYTLRVKDIFGCTSDVISKKITVNSLPQIKIVVEGLDSFCEGNVVKLSPIVQSAIGYKWSTGESTREIYTSKEGLYTLAIKDENGCESSPDSLNLKYIPSPTATITTSNQSNTICNGMILVLSSSDAAAYYWSNGSNSKDIKVDRAGVYTLTIRDEKNCFSKPNSITVDVKENPPSPTLNVDGAFQLSAILPTTSMSNILFNWKKDNEELSAITPILKANTSGNYSVRTIVKYPLPDNKNLTCFSTYSNNINVFVPYLDKGLRVYPNPNPNGIITLETIDDNPNAIISVFNIIGEKVYTSYLSDLKEKRTLDLRQLEKGEYILRLHSGNYEASSRIIIK